MGTRSGARISGARATKAPSAARLAALQALGTLRRQNLYAREALRKGSAAELANAQDRALAWRLVMGVCGARGLLEEQINAHLNRPKQVEPRVFDALELSAFELMYLSTPIAVAVSEGVALVKRLRPQAAGLANAVLRKIAPLREEVVRARGHLAKQRYTLEELMLVSGMPRWLAEGVYQSLGENRSAAFGLSTLLPAPRWVVATAREASETKLRAADLEPSSQRLPGIWRLHHPGHLEASGILSHGFSAMDRSAYEVALLTVPFGGASRLDVGVGRGTKALVAATQLALRGAKGRWVGVDSSKKRLREAQQRLFAAGVDTTLVLGDGRNLAALLSQETERFSVVFVDAPCSGTGTLRRHPEISWNLEPVSVNSQNPSSLIALQRELLSAASQQVAPGGFLFYSTCSVLRAENQKLCHEFLQSAAGERFSPCNLSTLEGFARLSLEAQAQLKRDGFNGAGNVFQTFPAPNKGDGHFLAAFRCG